MSWLDFLPDISLPEHIDLDIVNIGPEVEGDLVEGDVVDGDQIEAEYAIKSEGDLIPLTEIERVVFGRLSGDAPLDLRDGGDELVIDQENLAGDNEWEEVVKPRLKAGWEDEGAVSTQSAYPILRQAERNVTDEQIAEIEAFFRDKIFSADFRLLQSSLTIDRVMNAESGARMSDEELRNRKRELAEKYHDAAYSLPSMCTSGYFDEGELFRQVYAKMESREGDDVDDYDSVFRKLISNKPFVAYARDSQSVEELTDIVLGKIRRLPNYDVPLPYIDIRGIGKSNHQKIRSAMDAVEDEHGSLDYDEEVGDRELIVRISGESIRASD